MSLGVKMKYIKNYKIVSSASLIVSFLVALGVLVLGGHINETSIEGTLSGKGPYLALLPLPLATITMCVFSGRRSHGYWKLLPIIGAVISLTAIAYIFWIRVFVS